MSGYNKFDAERYSEELFSVTEEEHDEVMRLMAEEGYQEVFTPSARSCGLKDQLEE